MLVLNSEFSVMIRHMQDLEEALKQEQREHSAINGYLQRTYNASIAERDRLRAYLQKKRDQKSEQRTIDKLLKVIYMHLFLLIDLHRATLLSRHGSRVDLRECKSRLKRRQRSATNTHRYPTLLTTKSALQADLPIMARFHLFPHQFLLSCLSIQLLLRQWKRLVLVLQSQLLRGRIWTVWL